MAEITIDAATLAKTKQRSGVYASLNKPNPLTLELVEHAFKKYAVAHGCKSKMVETEWLRLRKILIQEWK